MKKRVNRLQFGYGFLAALLAVCMLFLGVYIGSRQLSQVEAQENTEAREKYYTSIQVEDGDTLWNIAEEYMTEDFEDRDSFMNEVRQMNNLTGSIIRSGDILLIPYYAESR